MHVLKQIFYHRSSLFKKVLKLSGVIFLKLVTVFTVTFVICEFLIYPLVLIQCNWPQNEQVAKENETLRAMFLADTHLLGPFRGHWFDKLRREWQMHRAFQTAMSIFQPEAVFFLGDVFDEGNWVNGEDFDKYVKRFEQLFSMNVNSKTRSFAVSGNHDMGFHYEIIPFLHRRFNKAFNTTSVRQLKLKGSNFLLLNSMAMQMDNCFLCAAAIESLRKMSRKLECEENPDTCLKHGLTRIQSDQTFNRPILLQHFPMFRLSDAECIGDDVAPEEEKFTKFREGYDCLSKESSQLLLRWIRPRLILSGHTHHHCLTKHEQTAREPYVSVDEYSVPSFSWRNRNNPSFYLAIVTPQAHRLSKCYLPKESTVYLLYGLGGLLLLLWIIPTRLWITIFHPFISRFKNSSKRRKQ